MKRVVVNEQLFMAVLAALLVALAAPVLTAQSLTTGDIAGTVRDPSGAVVPNATVTLKSLDTGATQSGTTGSTGEFRFRLLKTGEYRVSTSSAGFQQTEQKVEVAVGSVVTVNLALQVGVATQTVEVSAASNMLNPEPSMNTAFTPQQLAQLPSAGGDITTIAFTVPGVTVNVTGGFGNFNMNGLPGTSNLFTVNGENDMDPYFNINNSGASNLTIGQNELQEATVIGNPYGGQYGQLAGAQVSYVTKSGTNQFHGNAQYLWNGRAMNSNNWFNNATDTPRAFSNANQWAASIGGPIRKDKTFFFVDTEGLKFILPNVDSVTIPTPAFANAVLANVQAKQPNEAAAYKTMLGLWGGAPGAAAAQAIPNNSACNSLTLAGFNPSTTACAARFQATPNALGSEWILAFKVDQKIGSDDNASFRYKGDHGTQPTSLDPISANFDAISKQPSYDFQFQETHIFGSRSTNQFTSSLSHYVAQFQQDPALVQSTFPFQISTSATVPFTGFNAQGSFPQGRNITQYQFIDDFTLTRGRHNFKFGLNFRRYDVSDHNFFFNNPQVFFGQVAAGLQNFADGVAFQYRKTLNQSADVPIALWGIGLYAQDEWAVASNLKLTLALRGEHNSNPVCQFNCFANLTGPASTLASFTSADPGSVPYSSDLKVGQHQAYQGVDAMVWSPRIGFSYSPGSDHKTVISGGFMIAYDNPPAGLVDDLLANPPAAVAIRVRPTAGTLPFDPAGGAATWQASANAFALNKTFAQLSSQLAALGSVFAAPAVTGLAGTIHAPMWREWNIQVQRQLSNSLVLTANYVGNSGTRLLYSNAWPNAFDQFGLYPGVPGIPANAPVPNYGTVTQVQNGAISNYNGLSVTLTKRFSNSVAFHFNYTWAHNLDECSNGCLFSDGNAVTVGGQINPLNLRVNNYGNSDYDIRHNFSGDFVVNPKFKSGSRVLRAVANNWQFSGKVFWRTGLPFSVTDNNSALGNGGGTILATPLGTGFGGSSCGSANAFTGGAVVPCINSAAYLDSSTINNFTAWSPQTRNQLRGPHYFDSDMSLFRNFRLAERATFGVGLQAFNVFNHPNFATPDAGLGDSTFGTISGMVNSPTSPYGSFLGFDSSVRVVQLSGKIVF
jgi:outer membrane receptor protein involved in Fe transport